MDKMQELLKEAKRIYFEDENDKKAFELFNEVYEKTGDNEAKFYVGEMTYYGLGTSKDLEKAYNIFMELYDIDRRAKEKIAGMYFSGDYVEEDGKKALDIYLELANDGKDETGNANYLVGYIYQEGFGVEKDLQKSFEYMIKAAELGNSEGLFWTGYKYFQGEGTEINDKEAIKWLEKAVEYDHEIAQWILGCIYLKGEENDIDVKSNKEYGIELLKKSAEQGYEEAINKLKELNIN